MDSAAALFFDCLPVPLDFEAADLPALDLLDDLEPPALLELDLPELDLLELDLLELDLLELDLLEPDSPPLPDVLAASVPVAFFWSFCSAG
jgi:hypothetical protein